jgi:aspartyl-tRNA synthetase
VLWDGRLPDVRAHRRRLGRRAPPVHRPTGDFADPRRHALRGYDLIVDGWELGGGVDPHQHAEVQEQVFKVIGMSEEEGCQRFGFL